MIPNPILLISLHADPTQPSGVFDGGGTHAYLRELTAGLARRGITCHIVTRRQSPELTAEIRVSPLTTLNRIDIGHAGPMDKRLLNNFHDQTVRELESFWERLHHAPQLIHSVYWNSGRAAMALSHIHSVPFVHTIISNGRGRLIRGADENADEREKVEEEVFRSSSFIFSISNSEKDEILKFYGVNPDKIFIVGRQVDQSYLVPAHDERGHPRLYWDNLMD